MALIFKYSAGVLKHLDALDGGASRVIPPSSELGKQAVASRPTLAQYTFVVAALIQSLSHV